MDACLSTVTVAATVRNHRCVEALEPSKVKEVASGLSVGFASSKLHLRAVATEAEGVWRQ